MKINLKNKKVLVYGMSESGKWVAKLLKKQKATVFLFDDNYETLKANMLPNCFMLTSLTSDIILDLDLMILSPAIESTNRFVQFAKSKMIKVMSEVEFASLFCKNLVAVTGTNGKTTTVRLITAMLKTEHNAVACGNIGYPLSRAVLENGKHIKVVEISSFMLENCNSFHPHIATITNIAPDHLIRHKTMEDYERLKYSIYSNLDYADYAVINKDNSNKIIPKCRIITYSNSLATDIYIKNGYIFYKDERIIAINQIKLIGKHNLYNIMCALAYAKIYKIKTKNIVKVLTEFETDRFRIEEVGVVNDIKFINDSKSTNITSTLACVDAIKGSVILLLGGSEKGLNYEKLFAGLPKRVKNVIFYGEIASKLVMSNNDKFPFKVAKTLDEAFDYAVGIALKRDNIVLSPASASYDQFENYVERGLKFNQKVKEYEASTKNK